MGWQRDRHDWATSLSLIFLGSKITAEGDFCHEFRRCLLLGRKAVTNLDTILQSRDFANKGPSGQSYSFSSSHVWMRELDHKESWLPKNWCFWTVVLEKTLESPLDCKEIQPVHPKGDQSWIFIGRTDAEAPILCPHGVKNWLIWKDSDAGKDRGQEEKETTEDEMVGWHHLLDGCEFEQSPGVGNGQGSLVCCSPRGCKEFDMTERLNWTDPCLDTSSLTGWVLWDVDSALNQYLWKKREGSRIGQRGKLSCESGPITSATRILGTIMASELFHVV